MVSCGGSQQILMVECLLLAETKISFYYYHCSRYFELASPSRQGV
jgi:hypothetical protein